MRGRLLNSVCSSFLFILLFSFSEVSAAVQPIAEFLKLNGSSRQDSLGGAYTALGGVADGVGANPASIYGISGLNAFLTYFSLFEGISYMRGFIGNDTKYGTFGINAVNLNSGSLQETRVDTLGNVRATGRIFGASSQAFGVTYANQFFWKMSVGITAKFIHESYAVRSLNTIAADIGVQKSFLKNRLFAGISAMNLGPGNRRADGTNINEQLPMMARLGLAYLILNKKNHEILFLNDTYYENEDSLQNGIGLEYKAYNIASLRLGYSPLSNNQSFSAGIGLETDINKVHYALDYGLQNNVDLGVSNRFTVRVDYRMKNGKYGYRNMDSGEPLDALTLAEKEAKAGKDVFMRLILVDGTELKGRILYSSTDQVVIEVPGFGAVNAPRVKIKKVKRLKSLFDN